MLSVGNAYASWGRCVVRTGPNSDHSPGFTVASEPDHCELAYEFFVQVVFFPLLSPVVITRLIPASVGVISPSFPTAFLYL